MEHFCILLSPEGRCEAYPVGVQLFLLMFYFWLVNVLWKKKNGHPSSVILSEFFPRNVLLWLDGMGNQKCPLIFFNLRYNKHYANIPLNINYIYKKCLLKFLVGFKFWSS